MTAGLDTLLTALCAELTDRIIPARGFTRRGPGGRPEVTDADLACLAVAQVLLRFDDERLKNLAPLMEAALRWLADATPGSAELLRRSLTAYDH